MWISERFANVELLRAFLNERRLRASQCLVVTAENANGAVFHLLYHDLEDADEPRQAVVEAELLPVFDAPGGNLDDAVGTAEAIIKEGNRREP